ncbi:deoxyribodipyrimidine photolyase [Niastella yeongjuensis]|uniref:Deoxyribodipyrimidine photolyase n=1 Tax=Niastella yeongjuensis TaxID=354355 RepID=A0A1V9EZ43_9BACT|nr:deoxyribodipyrimidine photo-lyase [Niastella yeongjuensis]OQP51306.1 deoxyribodipyrimidine photolyase [Niastella yeongjuensis]SEP39062.1 deoxyribodipyrimidine photo-lyase [Niastella yeongjuensis]
MINIFWFRRDLRLEDNAGLYHALKSENPVLPIFIFDTNILNQLPNSADRRVEFIHNALTALDEQLKELGATLVVYHDTPLKAFKQLVKQYTISAVFTNHDYEPYARERDEDIARFLKEHEIAFHTYKDQVIFEKNEVVKDDGKPYSIFTPYSKKWKANLSKFYLKSYPTKKYFDNFHQHAAKRIPSLKAIRFEKTDAAFPPDTPAAAIIKRYNKQRDIPGIKGTSHLGVHLRFGTISIRQLAQKASKLNETFLNELIWRDFFQMILWHFPHVGKGKAFKAEYDFIKWRDNETEFTRWCEGNTGYPIVDAGMRELNTTGFMHNRVRMIAASFLAKHLLIDWRWGEAYFAEKLLDFELASNNGNWQWAAGCGCDAAPYFRIFNPYTQTKKFDPDLTYIKKWVPEFEDPTYPAPIVDHETARKRCLETYKKGLAKAR